MNIFNEILEYPEKCENGMRLDKKVIYEQAQLKTRDKEIFTKNIEKIIWSYNLKPEYLNISPYHDKTREYSEVEIFDIYLRKDKKLDRIADIMLRAIPYPMLLVFYLNNSIKIYVSHIREHGSDGSKITLEKIIHTEWINLDKQTEIEKHFFEELKIENISGINIYEFYDDIVNKIIKFNASKIKGTQLKQDSNETKEIMEKVEKLEKEIFKLEKEISQEKNMGQIVILNTKRHDLNQKKKELINKLK